MPNRTTNKHTPEPCVLAELQHAHQIIQNALAIMTTEQKLEWARLNERYGCDGDGATRHHERADVLACAAMADAMLKARSQP